MIRRPVFGDGTLHWSCVSYLIDTTHRDGPQIPLGGIATLRIGSHFDVGLIARTHLSSEEADLVGALVRGAVSRPFEMLSATFDSLVGPPTPAQHLKLYAPSYSAHSYRAVVERQIEIPDHIARADTPAIMDIWAQDKFPVLLTEEYLAFLEEHLPNNGLEKESKQELRAA